MKIIEEEQEYNNTEIVKKKINDSSLNTIQNVIKPET
jgi:hypothetical protein